MSGDLVLQSLEFILNMVNVLKINSDEFWFSISECQFLRILLKIVSFLKTKIDKCKIDSDSVLQNFGFRRPF